VKAKPIQRGLQCPIPKSEIFAEYLSSEANHQVNNKNLLIFRIQLNNPAKKILKRDTVQVDVRFSSLETPLVSTQVRLLDCSRETTCHSCTKHSECNWCMESNACVAKSERACHQYVRGPHDGISSGSVNLERTFLISLFQLFILFCYSK